MLIIGDIHAKNKQPHWMFIQKMFEELITTYKEEVLVLLGDVFDTSSPVAEIEEAIANYLVQFKEVHIVSGNHDQSKRLGNTLLPLRVHENIHVYTDKTEVVIDGKKCLILPYKDSYREYESIEWKGDYCFLHVTNVEDAFSDEGVSLKGIDAVQIYGHTHTHKVYDKNKIVLGVPLPTRNLEVPNSVIVTSTSGYEFVNLETSFYYETVSYGEFPINKSNIINVVNAPSRDSVFDKYKDYWIREEGIQILRNENDLQVEEFTSFENGNILDKFAIFSKENEISKEVTECISSRLSKIL